MIAPLTADIYQKFTSSPPKFTLKGFASIKDGEPMLMGGVAFTCGCRIIFLNVKDGFSKKELIKGWRALRQTLEKGVDYYAQIDLEKTTAKGLLEHLGFTYLADDIYIYKV